MGQCYSVDAKLIVKDEESFCKCIQQTMKDMEERAIFHLEDGNVNTAWGCFQIICPNAHDFGDGEYCADFDASYGWESVMLEIFEKAFDFVEDGSYFDLYPDSGKERIYREKGKTKTNY